LIGLYWVSLQYFVLDPENRRLRLVASANGALYVGDAALRFTLKEFNP
jgi:hypothetical protein